MGLPRKRDLVSVQEYLAGERASEVRHEYVGGVVYAMAGARNSHDPCRLEHAGHALDGAVRKRVAIIARVSTVPSTCWEMIRAAAAGWAEQKEQFAVRYEPVVRAGR